MELYQKNPSILHMLYSYDTIFHTAYTLYICVWYDYYDTARTYVAYFVCMVNNVVMYDDTFIAYTSF